MEHSGNMLNMHIYNKHFTAIKYNEKQQRIILFIISENMSM